jgi:predicted dehydrogenase
MKTTASQLKVTRRHFIGTMGAAMAFPAIVPSSVFGGGGQPAPSNRIALGVVGWGWQGRDNTQALMGKDCRIAAICDVDNGHLTEAVTLINRHYGNEDCKKYHDYREMMARTDIDAVMLAVPDHWHALIAVEAARHKKDIYGEKPLAKTIAEQQAIVKAVKDNGCIFQVGSFQRSQGGEFHKAAEIVRNGLIGKLTRVEVGLPDGHSDIDGKGGQLMQRLAQLHPPISVTDLADVLSGTAAFDAAVTPVPEGFDYPFWLGPSREEPYIEARIMKNWRWNYNIGGGQLMDWVGHHVDIAHWGMDADESGPSEIEGHGDFPDPRAIWNTCTKCRIELKYPNDVAMTIASGYPEIKEGTKWIGTGGWVWVDRGGFDCSQEEWKGYRELPEELRKVKLYSSTDHRRNFIDCCKSRQPPICPAEVGHHSTIPGHLGLISMLTGRKIKWDVKTESILGDAEASKLMSRPYREPWKLA